MTLRPAQIRLGPSSSSQIHFMMEIAPISVQQHVCTPHVDQRKREYVVFLTDFLSPSCFCPSCERNVRSVQVEGWCMGAEDDNTLLEYHPERRLETSPSRPKTSQLWYGHYGNLCALDAFSVPAPVIETLVMHGAVQECRWREENKKIFGGFKFLMARKSPQYILGSVWCVSMVACVLSNGEGGLGWERRADTWYRDSEPSTIHPMSPFCHHHRQKFVLERTGQQLLKTLLRQEFLF